MVSILIFLALTYLLFLFARKKLEAVADQAIKQQDAMPAEKIASASPISSRPPEFDYKYEEVVMTDAPQSIEEVTGNNKEFPTQFAIEEEERWDARELLVGGSPSDLQRSILISEILQRKF